MSEPIRLQKILAGAGVASRRAAERLVLEGRVRVNGEVVRTLGTRADPERDEVRVDERRVPRPGPRHYLLVNKPLGYLSTRHDPQGRRTVLDLLPPDIGYVFPVGRLDYDSEGLLLVTNDGPLAAGLTHPRHAIEREYEVVVEGVPEPKDLERLARGVTLDGKRTAPAVVRLVRTMGGREPAALLSVAIREGRNRQVRRMCEQVGHPVRKLRRVRIGPIVDRKLALGGVRRLSDREIAALRRAVAAGDTR